MNVLKACLKWSLSEKKRSYFTLYDDMFYFRFYSIHILIDTYSSLHVGFMMTSDITGLPRFCAGSSSTWSRLSPPRRRACPPRTAPCSSCTSPTGPGACTSAAWVGTGLKGLGQRRLARSRESGFQEPFLLLSSSVLHCWLTRPHLEVL